MDEIEAACPGQACCFAVHGEQVERRRQNWRTLPIAKRPPVDARGLAFFIAHPKAYDGPPREVESEEDEVALSRALRTLFRFGGALEPGLHHDAQRSDGSALQGAKMYCDEDGRIEAFGDYANVYPNDVIRVDRKEPDPDVG